MAKINSEILTFNRGVVSPLALARTDVKRLALSAETQTNWLPHIFGAMSLRPGMQHLGSTKNDAAARYIPFVFATDDTALLEFTDSYLRVWVDDALVTRTAISTAVTNGTFDTDLTGWADADEGATATSSWLTGGYMSLLGDGTNYAIRTQTLTVAAGDANVEHALRLVVSQGSVTLRIGSTAGGDEYFSETTLGQGTHSLAFTPAAGNVYVRVSNRDDYASLLSSCEIEGGGVLSLPTSLTAAYLSLLNYTQSGDVVFIATKSNKPIKVERRSSTSWSVVDFLPEDGPFRDLNLTPITLAASALTGSITLTASKALFKSTNVGSLFALTSTGQQVTKALSAAEVFSDPIEATGLTAERGVAINITGTWVATVVLQRSVGNISNWTDVTGESYTTNQSKTYNDGFDNQLIYYRIGIKAAGYTSGSATATLSFSSGSIKGIAKVTAYNSATSVNAVVLKDMGSTAATTDWSEGSWSPRRGYPSAVALYESRLWFAGKDQLHGSVSDSYSSFDEDYEGDAGPINRSIGSGPVDAINWLVASQRLVIGTQGSERVVRSSSLDEPITPTNFNIKPCTTHGSSAVPAIELDTSVIFIARSGKKVIELAYEGGAGSYSAVDLTIISPEVCEPSIVRTAVQRLPETRFHGIRSDGKAAVLTFDKGEDVKCWTPIETEGTIEDVVVLPGSVEDAVYNVVNRTINGATKRYLEKWSQLSECVGGTLNKQVDSFAVYSGAATTSITGLSHLEGKSVACWAAGADKGTFTVAAGSITLPAAVTSAVTGLVYTADFKSSKLALAAAVGSALTQRKRIDHLGLVLANTHKLGLQYGQDTSHLDDLPLVEDGTEVADDYVWDSYDADSVELNGVFDTDSRLCLRATAPKPCTVMAVVVGIATHDKI